MGIATARYVDDSVIISSVLSETCLVLATGVSMLWLWRAGWRACALCLTVLALAAAAGALEYAGFSSVTTMHARLSKWAAVAAFPAFAMLAAWTRARGEPSPWLVTLLFLILLVLGERVAQPEYPTLIGMAGLLALLFVTIGSFRQSRIHAGVALIAGCVLSMVAGLAIGTQGSLGGLPRVDWFHLCLSSAQLAYGWGLVRSKAVTYIR